MESSRKKKYLMAKIIKGALLFLLFFLFFSTAGTAYPQENVSFTTKDGVGLNGHLFGKGEVGVVLAHMYPTDQTSWYGFAKTLSDKGYKALTFDFRGYGDSGGKKDISQIDKDVEAAVRFLMDRGVKKAFLVGASMGGTASLKIASREKVAGVVSISGPTEFRGLSIKVEIGQIKAPKLFIVSRDEHPNREISQEQHNNAPEPKEIRLLPGSAHGTFIFDTPQREELEKTILEFLEKNRWVKTSRKGSQKSP